VTWQPISTAPKDGTEIDVWIGSERVVDVFWSHKRNAWCRSEYEQNFGYVDYTIQPPTHWMPIPSPPQEPQS